MAHDVEGVEKEILRATEPGFRGRLLAQGQARSLIWREGKLPPDAPGFSVQLSYDLLSYGYGLLGHGLRLLEEGGNSDLARRAFEFSADALESVVTNGADSPDRDFHRFVAAAGYHLGGFSARAYSMLNAGFNDLSLSEMQRSLSLLMLRRLDGLEERLNRWRLEGKGDDTLLADRIGRFLEDEDFEDESIFNVGEPLSISEFLIQSADLALTDNFLRSLSAFTLALERGERELLDESTSMLLTGLESAAELNMVPQWWCHRIAVYLINDLWDSSFHARLPSSLGGSASLDWPRLREIFVALLMRRSRAEIELWPSQLDATLKVTGSSENMVVSLPTSAGKTRIAELCILRCVAEGKRVVFVTPLRALSAQTEIVLQRTFAPLGKTVTSLYGNIGASAADKNVLKNRDIIVATPEKLDFALRNDPSLLDDVGLVVLDEGHMIGLGEREVRYEVQIQRLLKRDDADKRRIVCLSAVLPEGNELNDFVGWFTNDEPAGLVKESWRPTNIRYGEVIWYGDHARLNITVGEEQPFVPKFIESTNPLSSGKRRKSFPADQQELTLAVAWRLVKDRQTVLVFCPQKNSVFSLAKKIVQLHSQGFLNPLLEGGDDSLDTAIAVGEEWFGHDHPLLQCLRLGVAVHHGALPTPYRREVERLLRTGNLKVTISSPTLAQGLNLSATALIMFSIYRGGEPVSGSEFKNIKGRAGRAFTDLSGLVLHPIYKGSDRRRIRRWRDFIEDDSGHNVRSGLFRLLYILLERMCKKISPDSCKEMIEYIANNAEVWRFSKLPEEDESTAGKQEKIWNKNLSTLDTAVLALLGERDIKDNEIEEALDAIMSSSLFKRTLEREDDEIHALVLGSFIERARCIWKNTTATQRRGYFLAGVGLETGKSLDAHAEDLNRLLREANASILNRDKDRAIETICSFAEIIFKIPDFKPDVLPEDWNLVLGSWLEGESMAVFSMNDNDEALHFIEQGISYRLAWGMDAVRVRGLANDDLIGEDGVKMSDYELDYAVAAVETGTLNRSAALLMQSGFGSRSAAIKVARENSPALESYQNLRDWLKSEEVVSFSDDADWPTPETHDLWVSFVKNFSSAAQSRWRKKKLLLRVIWDDGKRPAHGAALKIITRSDGKSIVLNAQSDRIGKLKKKLNSCRKGLLLSDAIDATGEIQLIYCGPNDLFFERN